MRDFFALWFALSAPGLLMVWIGVMTNVPFLLYAAALFFVGSLWGLFLRAWAVASDH